MYKTLTGYLHR